MTMKIGIDVKYTKGYTTMKPDFWYLTMEPDFWYLFLNLNYVAKFPNWSVAMATVLKIRLHDFVRNIGLHHLPKYG